MTKLSIVKSRKKISTKFHINLKKKEFWFKLVIFGYIIAIRMIHEKKEDIFKCTKDTPLSCKIQLWFWRKGISIHNPFRNECTQDFSCCVWPGDKDAGFLEQLVATAKGVQDGEHTGIMCVSKPVGDTKCISCGITIEGPVTYYPVGEGPTPGSVGTNPLCDKCANDFDP